LGQKTHPVGFRLGVIKSWNSRWFATGKNVADLIQEDIMVKRYISRRLENAGIAKVSIARQPKKVTVDIHTSRPGIVIGRKGAEVDKLREELQLLTSKDITLNIVEVRRPELDAQLVADSIARQLEGRVSFRRAMKKSLAATMRMGAEGCKVQVSGRLGGAEIARTEKYREGRVPLHTLRADIDYANSTAVTTYGSIGVKVWICRGEIIDTGQFRREVEAGEDPRRQEPGPPPTGRRRRGGPPDKKRRRPRGRVRRPQGQEGRPPKGRRPEARPKGGGEADASKGEAKPKGDSGGKSE
jgi:small subunit ribosomal protein S3